MSSYVHETDLRSRYLNAAIDFMKRRRCSLLAATLRHLTYVPVISGTGVLLLLLLSYHHHPGSVSGLIDLCLTHAGTKFLKRFCITAFLCEFSSLDRPMSMMETQLHRSTFLFFSSFRSYFSYK